MTNKTDGKSPKSASSSSSSSRNSSSESFDTSKYKTQGPEKEEYVAHDITGRSDYKRPETSRSWLFFGAFLGIVLAFVFIGRSDYDAEMAAVQERLLKKQAEEQMRQQQQRQQKESETFHDA